MIHLCNDNSTCSPSAKPYPIGLLRLMPSLHTRAGTSKSATMSNSPTNFIDLTGRRFGRLIVVKYVGMDAKERSFWQCLCDCGKIKEINGASLRRKATQSCGCIRNEKIRERSMTHGESKTPEHGIWCGIKSRTGNPNSPAFPNYGGRGIKMCDRWIHSFENFLADMGKKPTPKHTIERKNNEGNYDPDNCTWATRMDQSNNKRSNKFVTYNGKTLTISQLARESGITPHQLNYRITKMKWPIEEAVKKLKKGKHHAHYISGSKIV